MTTTFAGGGRAAPETDDFGARGLVSGRVRLLEGEDPVRDVGDAIIWLEGDHAVAATPAEFEVVTSNKMFSPRILIVPVGSTVSFPNNDPFNHNVFSRSAGGVFDLGLYGRGTARSTRFDRTGIMRIYCNVHPDMSALIHVRDNRHYTQAGNDGSFSIRDVPTGTYVLNAWHERAAELLTREVLVTEAGVTGIEIELDARGYQFVQHTNKYGRPYTSSGRRY